MQSPPRWWHLIRWIQIVWLASEVRALELEIELEEHRMARHAERMRSWRALRAEKLGRLRTLRGFPGSVSFSGMTGRNPT